MFFIFLSDATYSVPSPANKAKKGVIKNRFLYSTDVVYWGIATINETTITVMINLVCQFSFVNETANPKSAKIPRYGTEIRTR